MIWYILGLILTDQVIKNIVSFKIFNAWISFGVDVWLWDYILFIKIFLIGILIYFYKKRYIPKCSFVFIISWWLSNIIDRLIYGYVIDYIDFFDLFVFNLADMYINLWVICFILYEIRKYASRKT